MRLDTAFCVLVAGSIALMGCGDEEERRGTPLVGAATTAGSGGAGGDGAGGEGNGAPVDAIDIADTDCVPRGGTEVELLPNDPFPPLFRRLASVGNRRVTGYGEGLQGFVTFDTNGSNAGGLVTLAGEGNRFAPVGNRIGVVSLSSGEVVYQRYRANGNPQGSTTSMGAGESTVTPAIGGSDQEALVVWGSGGNLQARGVGNNGNAVGPEFELSAAAYEATADVVVASRTGGFAVAWSTSGSTVTHATRFALATTTATDGATVDVVTGTEFKVVRLVKIQTGYALLLSGPQPYEPYVVLLDEQGVRTATFRVLGAYYGWDIAVQGDELGLLAPRATQEPQFRPFDAGMNPLGPWVCLDVPTNIDHGGAIDADGSGYAIVYHRPVTPAPEGRAIFVQIDNRGQ